MEDLYLLAGTYTKNTSKGIYLYKFDEDKGHAEYLNVIEIENPSYLAVFNRKYIYAVSENEEEAASSANALLFDEKEKEIAFLNSEETKGASPCYIDADNNGKFVATANYGGASISIFKIADDGRLQKLSQLIKFQGKGIDSERQEAPHPHCVKFSPDGKFLFVTDLGTDRICRFSLDYSDSEFLINDLPKCHDIKPGSGPRHVEFHPSGKYLYLINELAGNVIVFDYNNGDIKEIQTIQADMLKAKGSADIKITPDGRFLFASNRLAGDGIAIFSIDKTTGFLSKIAYRHTGTHPRNMEISPNGKYLLVANMISNIVEIFEIKDSGQLEDTQNHIKINMPVCLKFIK